MLGTEFLDILGFVNGDCIRNSVSTTPLRQEEIDFYGLKTIYSINPLAFDLQLVF